MTMQPETLSVTALRERTREILENAHFRGRRYVIERAGQEMAVILGVEEYRRLTTQASAHSGPSRSEAPYR
jgi:prevent-host-death family protein